MVCEQSWGWTIETSKNLVCFGNRSADINTLQALYPDIAFRRVRQVHGSHIVELTKDSPDLAIEADGSWTTQAGLALCSITADCIPILITSQKQDFVMALHAGWRGVARRILLNGLKLVDELGITADELRIFIGPHIQPSSFEVQQDALDLLGASCDLPLASFAVATSPVKYKVDLQKILVAQAVEQKVQSSQIVSLPFDTMTDPRLHSYRRDHSSSGRQISFVLVK